MSILEGQVAVVTGAGRGIGRAIALKFAEAGADVACVSRTEANSAKVAEEVRALGRKAWPHAVDVSDPALSILARRSFEERRDHQNGGSIGDPGLVKSRRRQLLPSVSGEDG